MLVIHSHLCTLFLCGCSKYTSQSYGRISSLPERGSWYYTNLLFYLSGPIYPNPNISKSYLTVSFVCLFWIFDWLVGFSSHRHPLSVGYIPNISLFMASLYYLLLCWGFPYWLSFPLPTWECFLDGMYLHCSFTPPISFHLLSSIFSSRLVIFRCTNHSYIYIYVYIYLFII